MRAVAVIPARGGSKRIPRKNIRSFHGKPMIAWPIAAARESGCFDDVLVSTEDAEIAATARDLGASVLPRPDHLADDHATIGDVMAFTAQQLDTLALCCIYATAPFVLPEDLRASYAMLGDGDYVLPVVPFDFPIQRAVRVSAGSLQMFQPEHLLTRSQDLEPAYHDAGLFCWGSKRAWEEKRPVYALSARAMVIPSYRAQDIDTEEDWRIAEAKFAALGCFSVRDEHLR